MTRYHYIQLLLFYFLHLLVDERRVKTSNFFIVISFFALQLWKLKTISLQFHFHFLLFCFVLFPLRQFTCVLLESWFCAKSSLALRKKKILMRIYCHIQYQQSLVIAYCVIVGLVDVPDLRRICVCARDFVVLALNKQKQHIHFVLDLMENLFSTDSHTLTYAQCFEILC